MILLEQTVMHKSADALTDNMLIINRESEFTDEMSLVNFFYEKGSETDIV